VGMSPLTASAYFGTAEMVQFLLGRGADPNAPDSSGMTSLHFAVIREDQAMIAALIRAGADVNRATLASAPASDDPGTPLMLAANTEPANTSIVSTLLARGARVDTVSRDRETALNRARKRGQTAVVDALIAAGARPESAPEGPPTGPAGNPPTDVRSAVEKSLALLQQANRQFLQRVGCQSCHNAALPNLAIRLATELGFTFDRDIARTNAAVTRSSIASSFEKAVQMMDPDGGSPTSTSYALINLDSPADTATHAIVRNIAARQLPDGRWRPPYIRHPMENDVTATAISMRALQLYVPGKEKRYAEQVRKATQWLSALEPQTTEQRTFQLLGLTWAKAEATQRQKRAGELWDEQRPDGGWSQLNSLPSDAYATGEVLYALAETGMADGHRSDYQRGVRFLMQTQQADGSWHVASRAVRFQQHFETGFPYGKDQFLSAAATSWAAMALMLGTRVQEQSKSHRLP
jgi:Squalene-hopene cyclase C-terminal domain/Ankyrin repeats (3 copies)/Ankyrin repeat